MIFYQKTLSTVTLDMLIDAILRQQTPTSILNLHFSDHLQTKTLQDALHIIDGKRKSLLNPYCHSFLCVELAYKKDIGSDMMAMAAKHTADVLNAYFNGKLYIISVLYADGDGKIHPLIVLNDIEHHLQESSQEHLLMQDLFHILNQ